MNYSTQLCTDRAVHIESAEVRGQTIISFAVPIELTHDNRGLEPSCNVVVFEPAEARRRLAEQHGADSVIDPRSGDADGLSAGSFDIAFDAAGNEATVNTALSLLRARGQLVIVATWEKRVPIDGNLVVFKEINVTGKSFLVIFLPGIV